jgi:hypothetical protein
MCHFVLQIFGLLTVFNPLLGTTLIKHSSLDLFQFFSPQWLKLKKKNGKSFCRFHACKAKGRTVLFAIKEKGLKKICLLNIHYSFPWGCF